MNEVVEQAAARKPTSADEDVFVEYEAVRGKGDGVGLIDFSGRALVEVRGSEAAQFLNGLVTNDVKALGENSWMRAAFPTVQGRLIAEARVLHLSDDVYLFDTEAATHESVLKTLSRFTLAGDFHVRDLTSESVIVSLQGSRSSEIAEATFGCEFAQTKRGRVVSVEWREQDLRVIRATHTGEDGFDVFVHASNTPALVDAFIKKGARRVGAGALEILRIEAGIPRFGVDMDETNVVLEAVSDEAVSFTKGCYVGQEIIARIHWRGHVAKKLTGLKFDNHIEAHPGGRVATSDDKEIGRVTSVTFSPRLNCSIALGYVKYDYLKPGTEVRVLSGETELTAYVASLPFVRGSWYDKESVETDD